MIDSIFKACFGLSEYLLNKEFTKILYEIYLRYLRDRNRDNHFEIISELKVLLESLLKTEFPNKYQVFAAQPINDCIILCVRALNQTHTINPVEIKSINFHPAIDPKDIKPNGKILSDEEIAAAQNYDKRVIGKLTAIYINNHHYCMYKKLGEGVYGAAYLSQNLETGTWYVIKYADFKTNYCFLVSKNEIKILRMLNRLADAQISRHSAHLAMPIIQGVTLSEKIPKKRIGIVWLKRLISLCEEVKQLHQANILHGDLHCKNILCDSNDQLHVIDHGLSLKVDEMGRGEVFKDKYAVFNAYYSSNSELKGKDKGIYKATEIAVIARIFMDIFDLGDYTDSYIDDVKPVNKFDLPDALLKKLISLFNLMIHPDYTKRPTLQSVIEALKLIENDCLQLLSKFKKIGFVYLDEIFKNGKINPLMLAPLRQMDEVYLVNAQVRIPPYPYQYLFALLRKEGINPLGIINNNHYAIPRDGVLVEAKNAVDVQEDKTHIKNYFLITTSPPQSHPIQQNNICLIEVLADKTAVDYEIEIENKPKLDLQQFVIVMEGLRCEINRLNKKYSLEKHENTQSFSNRVASNRKTRIENTIEKIKTDFSNNELTLHKTLKRLKHLEKAMNHTNSTKGFFGFLFGMNPGSLGAKNMANLRRNLLTKEKIVDVSSLKRAN